MIKREAVHAGARLCKVMLMALKGRQKQFYACSFIPDSLMIGRHFPGIRFLHGAKRLRRRARTRKNVHAKIDKP